MNNDTFAIESFINFCDDMMIAEEGFKDGVKNIGKTILKGIQFIWGKFLELCRRVKNAAKSFFSKKKKSKKELIKEKDEEIAKLKAQLNAVERNLKDRNSEIDTYKNKIQFDDELVRNLNAANDYKQKKIEEYQTQLQDYTQKYNDTSTQLKDYKQKYNDMYTQLENERQKNNGVDVAKLKERIDQLEKEKVMMINRSTPNNDVTAELAKFDEIYFEMIDSHRSKYIRYEIEDLEKDLQNAMNGIRIDSDHHDKIIKQDWYYKDRGKKIKHLNTELLKEGFLLSDGKSQSSYILSKLKSIDTNISAFKKSKEKLEFYVKQANKITDEGLKEIFLKNVQSCSYSFASDINALAATQQIIIELMS